MNPLIEIKKTTPLFLVTFGLACFGLSPAAQAITPAPDGGYPGQNTAEGQSALLHLAGGIYNTAIGWSSLGFDLIGNLNTAVGAGALLFNTADQNTATGAAALFNNTTGGANTANGFQALFSNTTGVENTAIGDLALFNNTTGGANTASGNLALFSNTTGSRNIALGLDAGNGVTTADNVICIGADGNNVDNSCYIGQIFGATSSGGTAVFINSNGRLGTATSSRRFKEEIKPMEHSSEAVFALKPVTFRYKKGIDPQGIPQFGLVAEEVEKVNPSLVVRDKDGKAYSVRYEAVNAMLLNEFLKEHQTVQQQGATIARLEKQIDALTAGLQKVSAQLELSKSAPQTVNNP
jgi:Chaperone of endosialidase